MHFSGRGWQLGVYVGSVEGAYVCGVKCGPIWESDCDGIWSRQGLLYVRAGCVAKVMGTSCISY